MLERVGLNSSTAMRKTDKVIEKQLLTFLAQLFLNVKHLCLINYDIIMDDEMVKSVVYFCKLK